MVERESMRYDGAAFRSTLVCRCGATQRYSIKAPRVRTGRPDVEGFDKELADKIDKAGWVDGWGLCAEWDVCPKCKAAQQL